MSVLHPSEFDGRYDRFLKLSGWLSVLYYTAPAAGILVLCWIASVPEKFWIPVLLIYLMGAVADLLTFGFQAVNIQIKTSLGWLRNEMVTTPLGEQLVRQRDTGRERDTELADPTE